MKTTILLQTFNLHFVFGIGIRVSDFLFWNSVSRC